MGLGYGDYVVHGVAWLDGGEPLGTDLAVNAVWVEPSGDRPGAGEITAALGDFSLVVRAVSRGEDAETGYLVLNADTLWLSNSIALDVAENGIFWAHHSSWSVTATQDEPRGRMNRPDRLPAMDVEFATRELVVTKKTDVTNYIAAGLLTPITLAVDLATVVFWAWLFAESDDDGSPGCL